jgi:hypothetical protein
MVVLQHGRVIHPVDMIARKNQDVVGAAPLQQVKVLIDGISCPAVPRLARPHLRRNWSDVFSQLGVIDRPPIAQMFLERMRLVLCQDQDPTQTGVETVAEREVDDAVPSSEGHRRLGPVSGQGMQP